MDNDRIIRLVGFLILIVSILLYVYIDSNKLVSFGFGVMTGIGLTCLMLGVRFIRFWKD
ncbi:MAG: hypothetical protein HYZ10_12305 [Ignavibacteriales bacterium]|nr:hypothetical protein [Ignavibacteriales bacterium]